MENDKLNIIMKLETANRNIHFLSEKVVELVRQRDKGYCCDCIKMTNGCDSNCEKCKDEYYKKMSEDIYNSLKVRI